MFKTIFLLFAILWSIFKAWVNMYNAISGWRWGLSIIKATPPKVPALALIQSFNKFISYIHCYRILEKSNTLCKLQCPDTLHQKVKIAQILSKNSLFLFLDFINKIFTFLTFVACELKHTTQISTKNKVSQTFPLQYPKILMLLISNLHHAGDHMFNWSMDCW